MMLAGAITATTPAMSGVVSNEALNSSSSNNSRKPRLS